MRYLPDDLAARSRLLIDGVRVLDLKKPAGRDIELEERVGGDPGRAMPRLAGLRGRRERT
jgi:hypothetical protein